MEQSTPNNIMSKDDFHREFTRLTKEIELLLKERLQSEKDWERANDLKNFLENFLNGYNEALNQPSRINIPINTDVFPASPDYTPNYLDPMKSWEKIHYANEELRETIEEKSESLAEPLFNKVYKSPWERLTQNKLSEISNLIKKYPKYWEELNKEGRIGRYDPFRQPRIRTPLKADRDPFKRPYRDLSGDEVYQDIPSHETGQLQPDPNAVTPSMTEDQQSEYLKNDPGATRMHYDPSQMTERQQAKYLRDYFYNPNDPGEVYYENKLMEDFGRGARGGGRPGNDDLPWPQSLVLIYKPKVA